MDDETLQQAIQLSKDGRKLDARKLLRPFLEVDPENEKAWLWYANSFDLTDEKLKACKTAWFIAQVQKWRSKGLEFYNHSCNHQNWKHLKNPIICCELTK